MATLTTRAGYWVLNWTDGRGRHRKSLGRTDTLPRRDAEAILRAKQYELSTGAKLLRVGGAHAPTFGQWAADYMRWHRGEFRSSHYRVAQIVEQHLLPRWQATPLDMLRVEDAEQWKTERRFLVRTATVTKELRVLHAMLNRAVELQVIAANPLAAVKAPKQLDSKPHLYYTAEALAKLYAASSPAHAAIWKLLANTGMRRGEARALRWEWVGRDSIRVISTGEERTKDGEWRSIPLSEGAQAALHALPRRGDYVLPRIAAGSLSRAFARDAKAAAIGGSLHTLRHSFVCHLLLAGVPIRTVQLYAGHAHITTTERYAYQVLGAAPSELLRLAL